MTAPALPFPLIWCQQKWGSCQELAMALKSWHIWARQHALVSCGVRFRQKTGVGIRRTSWFGLKYLLWSPQSQMKKKIVAFFCQKKMPEISPGLLKEHLVCCHVYVDGNITGVLTDMHWCDYALCWFVITPPTSSPPTDVTVSCLLAERYNMNVMCHVCNKYQPLTYLWLQKRWLTLYSCGLLYARFWQCVCDHASEASQKCLPVGYKAAWRAEQNHVAHARS